jgi:hypothetical protein
MESLFVDPLNELAHRKDNLRVRQLKGGVWMVVETNLDRRTDLMNTELWAFHDGICRASIRRVQEMENRMRKGKQYHRRISLKIRNVGQPSQKKALRLQKHGNGAGHFFPPVAQRGLLPRRIFEPAPPLTATCIAPLVLLREHLSELDQFILAHVLQTLFSTHSFAPFAQTHPSRSSTGIIMPPDAHAGQAPGTSLLLMIVASPVARHRHNRLKKHWLFQNRPDYFRELDNFYPSPDEAGSVACSCVNQ